MAVGVGARVDDDDRVFHQRELRGVLRRGEVIEQLHRRFEARDFVTVHRAGEPDDGRRASRDDVELGWSCAPWVGDAVEVGPDGVEPGDVLRRGDDVDTHGAALGGHTDLFNAYPVGRRLRDGQECALLLAVLRVPGADVVAERGFGARDRGAVGALGVEAEVAVVAEGVRGDSALRAQHARQEDEQRCETSAHGVGCVRVDEPQYAVRGRMHERLASTG